MDYLIIIAVVAMMPLTLIIIRANMTKTETRRFKKLKERADQNKGGRRL